MLIGPTSSIRPANCALTPRDRLRKDRVSTLPIEQTSIVTPCCVQKPANDPECPESDPYPRVILVPGLGLFTLGISSYEANLAADVAEHTIRARQQAGAHQISKIAALELAPLGVRVNMINPDAVFGDQHITSKLWDLIGPDRMKSRGLDYAGLQEFYRDRNLLKAQVRAEHVGNAVVFFASNQTPTTGASLPVDGGIPAAFPR